MFSKQNISTMKKMVLITSTVLMLAISAQAQEKLNLENIFSAIQNNHPNLKSYDAQIRALDEAAKGAKNWESPQLSTGLWMTPYDPGLWKKQSNGSPGMGQYMISAEQMFPNRKMQNAEQKYMESLSSVELERKNANINELY